MLAVAAVAADIIAITLWLQLFLPVLELQALLLILLLLVIDCSIAIVAFAANSIVALDVSSVAEAYPTEACCCCRLI